MLCKILLYRACDGLTFTWEQVLPCWFFFEAENKIQARATCYIYTYWKNPDQVHPALGHFRTNSTPIPFLPCCYASRDPNRTFIQSSPPAIRHPYSRKFEPAMAGAVIMLSRIDTDRIHLDHLASNVPYRRGWIAEQACDSVEPSQHSQSEAYSECHLRCRR